MEANFRRFSRAFRKKKQNRVFSLDNMLEERNPSTAGIKSFLSTDHFNFTDENDSDAVYVTRKRAWAEPIDMCDKDNKLTEDWMKDWKVRLKIFGPLQLSLRPEFWDSDFSTKLSFFENFFRKFPSHLPSFTEVSDF